MREAATNARVRVRVRERGRGWGAYPGPLAGEEEYMWERWVHAFYRHLQSASYTQLHWAGGVGEPDGFPSSVFDAPFLPSSVGCPFRNWRRCPCLSLPVRDPEPWQ